MVGGFGSDRFVLCEPFVLDCGNVATVGYKAWRDEIDERRLIVRRGPHHPIPDRLCKPRADPDTVPDMYRAVK